MYWILELCLFAIVVGALAAWRAPRFIWITVIAACLFYWTFSRHIPAWAVAAAWLICLPPALLLTLDNMRRRWLTPVLLEGFRRILPAMSDTEREALEAGQAWWETDLISGRPDWKRMLEFPAPRLSPEEQAFIDGPVDTLCALIDDWRITEELRDLPPEVWSFIRHHGFFGMIIPKRYGGLEFSAHAHSTVVMKVATRSISAAVTVMVPNSLGPAKLLLHYGSDEQKDYYLPRLARGEEIPCFALTGPEAGSDAASIPDTGVVCRGPFRGQPDVVGIRLNWEKRYITLGPVATVLGLAFRLHDPQHLLGDVEDIGITLALIPADTPGVEIGRRHFPLDHAFQNGPNRGRDVFIPIDWIIGGPARAGQGWRMLMECLSDGRGISLPALSAGSGKFMSRTAGAYAAVRRQFKLPIGQFEGIAEVLGRIAGRCYQMEAARGFITAALDAGENPSVASAITKYHLTERMRLVVNDAMDIYGGRGICIGPRNFVARPYQALPIGITVEGANILTRSLIIFGQGAIRCHPYLLREMQAAEARDVRAFDDALFGHVGLVLGNVARALLLALTRARFVRVPGGTATARYYRAFTQMSAAFSVVAETTMISLGGALKRRESISARLGDVLSQLYLGSAVLKHYQDQGHHPVDLPLMRWACEDLLHEAQEALYGVLENLPNRVLGTMVRALVFPLGRPCRRPADKLTQEVAALIMRPGEIRDRLTEGAWTTHDTAQPLGQLEDAFIKAAAAQPVERKLRAATQRGQLAAGTPQEQLDDAVNRGIINAQEAALVKAARDARRPVIEVDDFSPQQLAREDPRWEYSRYLHGAAGQSM
jgi:acyl-CoA dehydrogenase